VLDETQRWARLTAVGALPFLLALTVLAGCRPAEQTKEKPDAYILRLEGAISQAWRETLSKNIQAAIDEGVGTFIIELDTPGGTLGDSMELGDYIFENRERIRIIAYIRREAYSGGTIVALACDKIYINRFVGMMGDVAPVNPTGEIMGEKLQTALREKLTHFCHGRYPEALAQAMVTKEISVYALTHMDEPEEGGKVTYVTGGDLDAMPDVKLAQYGAPELVVPAGQLLTLSAVRADEFGFATPVDNEAELFDALAVEPEAVERIFLTATERLLVYADFFTPLLITAGIVLLFIEVSHPGFGLPGILGLACFTAFFLIKISLHYAGTLELILFAAGVLLLAAEVFIIPGFGWAGFSGLALIVVSLILAFHDYSVPAAPGVPRIAMISTLKVFASFAASIVIIAVLIRHLPSLPLLSRLVLVRDQGAARVSERSLRIWRGARALPCRPCGRRARPISTAFCSTSLRTASSSKKARACASWRCTAGASWSNTVGGSDRVLWR